MNGEVVIIKSGTTIRIPYLPNILSDNYTYLMSKHKEIVAHKDIVKALSRLGDIVSIGL